MDELISKEMARRIIDSPRNKKQMLRMLESIPVVEPQIIRCKDCKYNYGLTHDGEFNPEDIVCTYFDTDGIQLYDFCSYAERREDGQSC